jgi:Leucine-rich repeat (LRR) protein
LPALQAIPEEICYFVNLKEMFFSFNEIKALPESVEKLKALQCLDLTGNKVQELPASLGSLPVLTQLYLDNNALQELPASYSKLTTLHTIYLSYNKFKVPFLDKLHDGIKEEANELKVPTQNEHFSRNLFKKFAGFFSAESLNDSKEYKQNRKIVTKGVLRGVKLYWAEKTRAKPPTFSTQESSPKRIAASYPRG